MSSSGQRTHLKLLTVGDFDPQTDQPIEYDFIGRVIAGRYTIREQIGGGGMADVVDTVGNLAGSGDLSDVLGSMAETAGGSVADVAGDLADSGNFDDFTSDIIESEVGEAVTDEVWDDLGS